MQDFAKDWVNWYAPCPVHVSYFKHKQFVVGKQMLKYLFIHANRLYVHDSVPDNYLNDFNIAGIDVACIEIKHKLKSFFISCWYRSPGSRRETSDFLENIQTDVNLMLAQSP